MRWWVWQTTWPLVVWFVASAGAIAGLLRWKLKANRRARRGWGWVIPGAIALTIATVSLCLFLECSLFGAGLLIYVLLTYAAIRVLNRPFPPSPYKDAEVAPSIGGWIVGSQFVVFIGLGAALTPMFGRSQDSVRQVVCQSNMRSAYYVLHMYADAHDGACPSSRQAWLEWANANGDADILHEMDEHGTAIVWPARLADWPTTAMLIADSEPRHLEGRSVLYFDGKSEWLSEAEFQAALARPENAAMAEALRTGTWTPRVPATQSAPETGVPADSGP